MTELNQEIGEITEILSKWNEAKEESLDKVFPKVYENLKQLAKKARRSTGLSSSDETLCTTGLVSEMYFKLRKSKSLSFNSRGQFYALCLVAMRRILHDYYFRKISNNKKVSESEMAEGEFENIINLSVLKNSGNLFGNSLELAIVFDEILTKLAEQHPRKVEVVILKYWLDETDKDIARYLDTSEATVRGDLTRAAALIRYEIDAKMKLILHEAVDITDTTLRTQYLKEASGENKGLLRHLEIMLNEHLKKRKG